MSKYLFLFFFFSLSLAASFNDEHAQPFMDEDSFDSFEDDSSDIDKTESDEAFQDPDRPQAIIHADESDGPDSGNWFEKLKWWKEAKWLYTIDVTAAIGQLETISKDYKEKEKNILAALENYSSSLPIKRQTAEAFIDDLLATIQKRNEDLAQQQTKKQVRGMAKESAQLEENQKLLTQLKDNIKDFNIITQRLNQVFEQALVQQLAEAHQLDQKALIAYESIEKTLDDKIAQEKFNEVQNSHENIEAIIGYLEGPLNQFIGKAWEKAQQLMITIKTGIDELEKRGIIVKQMTAEEAAQAKLLEQKRDAEKKAAQEKAARPWWKNIIYSITSFFSNIWDSIRQSFIWVSSFFTASPAEKTVPRDQPVSKKKNVSQ